MGGAPEDMEDHDASVDEADEKDRVVKIGIVGKNRYMLSYAPDETTCRRDVMKNSRPLTCTNGKGRVVLPGVR
jgi:hypothetical protein